MACIWIVYTQQGSVDVLQVTGSLLLQFLLCYLILVYVCLCLSYEEVSFRYELQTSWIGGEDLFL